MHIACQKNLPALAAKGRSLSSMIGMVGRGGGFGSGDLASISKSVESIRHRSPGSPEISGLIQKCDDRFDILFADIHFWHDFCITLWFIAGRIRLLGNSQTNQFHGGAF